MTWGNSISIFADGLPCSFPLGNLVHSAGMVYFRILIGFTILTPLSIFQMSPTVNLIHARNSSSRNLLLTKC